MKTLHPKPSRVLAIAPSTRGFGFAVMDEKKALVDWGVKRVKGDKNARSLSHVADLIEHYRPNAIVLEDSRSAGTRRGSRIHVLIREIVVMAQRETIEVKQFPRKQLRSGFFQTGRGTKHRLAEQVATRFPEELAGRMPRKRRPWMSADYRMDIFDAVALAEHFLRSSGK